LETLKNSFSTDNLDPMPLHEFYWDYFNLVDLVDRYWYKVEEHIQYFNCIYAGVRDKGGARTME